MRHVLLPLVLFAALLAPSLCRAEAIVYGYLPYWEYEPSGAPWDELTHIAIFSVGLNADGTLNNEGRWTGRAAEAVAFGTANDVRVHLCLTSFDDAVQYAVLSDTTRRRRAVARLAELVHAYGADGVNVDFERVGERSRDLLVTFVNELKAEVDEVFLATPVVDWNDAFDYAALSRVSDGLFIMGYEMHGSWGNAGPNATLRQSARWGWLSLEWSVADYLDKGADPAKVIVGLPLYGHAWNVADANIVPPTTRSHARTLFYRDAVPEMGRAGRRFDDASSTPYYAASSTVQGWMDDAASIELKMRWAIDDAEVGGIGFWALGYDNNDPALWTAVAEIAGTDEPPPPAVFAAAWVAASFPDPEEGAVSVHEGGTVDAWIELRNVGAADWSPETTRLATLPRDAASPMADATWINPGRVAGVDGVVAPGDVGRFAFRITGHEVGRVRLDFAVVEEGVVWFADDGGPSEGTIAMMVDVVAAEGDVRPDAGVDAGPDGGSDAGPGPPDGGPDAGPDTPVAADTGRDRPDAADTGVHFPEVGPDLGEGDVLDPTAEPPDDAERAWQPESTVAVRGACQSARSTGSPGLFAVVFALAFASRRRRA